jgi:hypothetical protein
MTPLRAAMQGDGGRKAGGELAQEPKEANQETPLGDKLTAPIFCQNNLQKPNRHA